MNNASSQQAVAETRRLADELKDAYKESLRSFMSASGTSPSQIETARGKLQVAHEAAIKYFNTYEMFVGESHLAGAHGSVPWITGFAEDCHAVLDSVAKHFAFMNSQKERLGADFVETFSPSVNAFASMQRLVKRHLPADATALRERFVSLSLPVRGFDAPVENVPALPETAALFNLAGNTGPITIVHGDGNTVGQPEKPAPPDSTQPRRERWGLAIGALSAIVAILVFFFGEGVCGKRVESAQPFAVSIGQSGGQTANLIVNAERPDRTIPPAEAQDAISQLRGAPSCIAIASTQGDPEAFRFRGELLALFGRAGWDVRDAQTFMFFGSKNGLVLSVNPKTAEPTSLLKTLSKLASPIAWNRGEMGGDCPYYLQVWHR